MYRGGLFSQRETCQRGLADLLRRSRHCPARAGVGHFHPYGLSQSRSTRNPARPAKPRPLPERGGAWAIGRNFSLRLGLLALVPVVGSVAWIGLSAFDAPSQALGTAEQQAAADRLWQATEHSTEKYKSVDNARADGYIAFNPVSNPLVHYVNPAYMQDGRILDPEHVESLVYENTLHGPVLVAAMYSLEDPNAAPPDVAGQLTSWHRHDDLCFTPGGEVVGAAPDCPPGSATYYTPWMLHVWLVPNRYGRFAADLDPWHQLGVEVFG